MGRGDSYNRDATHRYIWKYYTDRSGVIEVSQRELAKIMGIHYNSVLNILRDFLEDGRAEKSVGRYLLVDPDEYDQAHPPAAAKSD
jgi:hypothetical protein